MKQQYIPAIDGLRAYSILSVILYHINHRWVPSGYLGVDVFFVISGFLITRILTNSDSKSFSETLISFYFQRARRILPALVGLTAGVLVVGRLLEGYSSFHFLISQIPAVLCSYTNFANYRIAGDYFGEQSDSFHFLHTWSLSVEEQFYVLYPLLLLGLRQIADSSRTVAVLAVLAAVSLASFHHFRIEDPGAGFYLPWNRAWELLIGALIALRGTTLGGVLPIRHPVLRQIIQIASFATILGCLFLDANRHPRVQNILAMLVCGAAGILLDTVVRDGAIPLLGLESKAMRWIGKTSYSAYLWHWPILVLVRAHTDAPYLSVPHRVSEPLIVLLIILCSCLSFFLIEQPLRGWRRTPHLILPGTALIALMVAISIPALALGSIETFRAEIIFGNRFCYNPMAGNAQGSTLSLRFPQPLQVANSTNLPISSRKGRKTVLFFGNSHGLGLAPVLNRITEREHLSIRNLFANGVSPFLFRGPGPHGGGGMTSEQVDRYDEVRRRALESGTDLCVLGMRYDHLQFDEMAPTLDAILERVPLLFIEQAPVLNIGHGNAVDRFNELINKAGSADRLHVIEPIAFQKPREEFEKRLLARYSGNPRFHFLKVSEFFIQSDGTIAWSNGRRRLYYFDDNHLTEEGVMLFEERLLASIRSILGEFRPPEGIQSRTARSPSRSQAMPDFSGPKAGEAKHRTPPLSVTAFLRNCSRRGLGGAC